MIRPSSSRNTSSRESSPLTSSMVPERMSLPPLMMATLSQSFSATSSTWVEKKMAPPCVADLPHHALEQVGRLGVQAYEGFVHNDELWIVDPGGDDGQLLLHAVGIGGDGLGQVVRQLEQVGVVRGCVPAGRWR